MSPQRRSSTKRGGTSSAPKRTTPPKDGHRNGKVAPPPPPPPPAPAAKPTSERAKAVVVARRNILAKRTAGIRRMVRDTWAETRKINWPDQQTTRNLTIVVIGISVVLGVFLGGLDYILFKIITAIP